MDPSFDCSNMLSFPDLELVVKLFCKNGESATKALRQFCTLKGIKAKKNPISLKGIMNAVHRFEETGRLEHRPRSGRVLLSNLWTVRDTTGEH